MKPRRRSRPGSPGRSAKGGAPKRAVQLLGTHQTAPWVDISKDNLKPGKHARACGGHKGDGGYDDGIARLKAGAAKREVERCGAAVADDPLTLLIVLGVHLVGVPAGYDEVGGD